MLSLYAGLVVDQLRGARACEQRSLLDQKRKRMGLQFPRLSNNLWLDQSLIYLVHLDLVLESLVLRLNE